MSILSLIARLGMDATGFNASMAKAGKAAEKFASDLKGKLAGAFSVGAMVLYVKSVADHVNRIKDLSEQYRITTDEVQKLDFAAKQSGLQFENVGRMLDNVNKAREEAATKGGKPKDAFEFFGVGADQYNNSTVSTLDIVKKISEAMSKMEVNPTVERAFAQLAGEKGLKLLSVIQEINKNKISIIEQAEIERIDIAIKKLEKLWLQGKNKTASFLGTMIAGQDEQDKDSILRKAGRAFVGTMPAGPMANYLEQFFRGKTKINEEVKQLDVDKQTKAAIAAFIKIPGLYPKAFEEDPEKIKKDKEAKALSGKVADADNLAKVGGFTSQVQQAQKVEFLVKQIVTHLQRGIKIQEL